MIIGKSRFIQPSIPLSKKDNSSFKAQKAVAFGTNLVNFRELSIKGHAKSRMHERNISREDILNGIKRGKAYDTPYSDRINVMDYTGNEAKDLMIVMEPDMKKVVTVFRPINKLLQFKENGDFFQTGYHNGEITPYHLIPEDGKKIQNSAQDNVQNAIQETDNVQDKSLFSNLLNKVKNLFNKPVNPELQEGNEQLQDVTGFKRFVPEYEYTDSGYKKLTPNGTVEFEHIIAENGYKDVKPDGTVIRAKVNTLIADETSEMHKADYNYLPLEGVIKCGGKFYADKKRVFTEGTQDFTNLKEQYFADCK
jgi:hypothetical protein